jgi:hypothetical protein
MYEHRRPSVINRASVRGSAIGAVTGVYTVAFARVMGNGMGGNLLPAFVGAVFALPAFFGALATDYVLHGPETPEGAPTSRIDAPSDIADFADIAEITGGTEPAPGYPVTAPGSGPTRRTSGSR